MKKEKYSFINNCSGQDLTEGQFSRIEKLLERNNVTQIIFTYGIDLVLCLINFFEYIEDYKTCLIIKNKIIIHNKNTNKEYNTHL